MSETNNEQNWWKHTTMWLSILASKHWLLGFLVSLAVQNIFNRFYEFTSDSRLNYCLKQSTDPYGIEPYGSRTFSNLLVWLSNLFEVNGYQGPWHCFDCFTLFTNYAFWLEFTAFILHCAAPLHEWITTVFDQFTVIDYFTQNTIYTKWSLSTFAGHVS